jgi:hypothetical protein
MLLFPALKAGASTLVPLCGTRFAQVPVDAVAVLAACRRGNVTGETG